MNDMKQKFTQKMVSKPVKYLIISSILIAFFVIGILAEVSIINLSCISIGVLFAFIVVDIIRR